VILLIFAQQSKHFLSSLLVVKKELIIFFAIYIKKNLKILLLEKDFSALLGSIFLK
jgi:hypothetical protein